MSRDEILKLGLDAAKDEYLRAQSRLALVETKAALVAATVGILLTLIAAVGPDHLPHSDPCHLILLLGMLISLGVALMLSVAASILVDVRPPQNADTTCQQCLKLIGDTGDVSIALDQSQAEVMLGNLSGSYLEASKEVSSLLAFRMNKLKAAQIALLVGLLFIVIEVGPYYFEETKPQATSGVQGRG
jgi:hypothetical protein